jgi:hypothetical protein
MENKMKHTFFQKVQIWFIELLAKVHWKHKRKLTEDDDIFLKQKFINDYYIIATRRSNYLTTFCIAFGNFFLTGHWGFYSHVLMNLEDEVKTSDDFRFIEATGHGTHYSNFTDVFGPVDAVALIKPKNMTLTEWTEALDKAKTYLGRPYDNLFNLKNDLEINCVELIRLALEGIPDYETKFAEFEKMIAKKKKLTPDMFANCPDFEVVYTIKR